VSLNLTLPYTISGAPGCQAGEDGDCVASDCPQLQDGEPNATGRSCPRPHWSDSEDW
jgi:hypothetical protein